MKIKIKPIMTAALTAALVCTAGCVVARGTEGTYGNEISPYIFNGEVLNSELSPLSSASLYPETTPTQEDQEKYLFARIGLTENGDNALTHTLGATDKHRSRIVVIDGGINYNHAEYLDANGKTRISDLSYSVTEQATVKQNGWSVIDDSQSVDFHGTQVASVIYANRDDGNGVAGLAPEAELIFVKVTPTSEGAYDPRDVQKALDYALEVKPDVVNLSMGAYNVSNFYGTRIKKLKDAGAVVVTAAGNNNLSVEHYPSADVNAIGVSSFKDLSDLGLSSTDYRYETNSSYGDLNVDLRAPGTFWQAYTDASGASLYKVSSGTSVATPVVTAAVALYRSLYPDSTVDEITQALYSSCNDYGDLGKDYYYGYGGLDIYDFLFGTRGTVKFEMCDGEVREMPITEGKALKEYPFPDTVPEGKYFGGWFKDKACTQPVDYYSTVFSDGDRVYSKWTDELTQGAFDYTVGSSSAGIIKGFYGNVERVIVPASFAKGGSNYTVSEIGARAFQGTDAKKIILPASAKTLGEFSFALNKDLKMVYLPEGLKSVGLNAFRSTNCKLLLQGNDDTENAKIFKVDEKYFRSWNVGAKLIVIKNAGDYFYRDGLEYTGTQANGYKLYCYDGEAVSLDLSAYANITEIESGAFSGNIHIRSLNMPDLTAIGDSAFMNCTALGYADMPQVKTIGASAFEGCSGLSEIAFNSSLTTIGKAAFKNCANLSEVDFTAATSLTEIGEDAFRYCKAIKVADMQKAASLNIIGMFAFDGCQALEVVALPDGVTSVGYSSFALCPIKAYKAPFMGGSTAKSHLGYVFGVSTADYQSDAVPATLKYVLLTGSSPVTTDNLMTLSGITVMCAAPFRGTSDCTVYADGNYGVAEIYYGGKLYGVYGGAVDAAVDQAALAASYAMPYGVENLAVENAPATLAKGITKLNLTADVKSFTIKFYNYDGTLVSSNTYAYGAEVSYEIPTRARTDEYTYEFAGWGKPVTSALCDAEYTAEFTPVKRVYTIRFSYEDGSPVKVLYVAYGEMPAVPEMQDIVIDNTYCNKFKNWNIEIATVTGNAEYVAVYEKTYREYVITFMCNDGTELSKQVYHYGDSITAPPTVRASNDIYCYEFTGWTEDFETVTADRTYTANFTRAYVEYEVVFKNYDGTVLKTVTCHYGEMPAAPEETPRREGDSEYKYVFIGWNPDVNAVTENMIYTAQYEQRSAKIAIRFLSGSNEISLEYYNAGETIRLPETPQKAGTSAYYYEFKGWTPEVSATAVADATYTAVFERHFYEKFKVTFKNYDGSVISEKEYYQGETVVIPQNPARKVADGEEACSYNFTGWDKPVVESVSAAAEYTAKYEAVAHNYGETVHQPTCTEGGYTEHKCSVCNDSYTDSRKDALGHSEGEWIVDREATEQATGRKHTECTRCHETVKEQTIPKLEPEKPEEPKPEQPEQPEEPVGGCGSIGFNDTLTGGGLAILGVSALMLTRFIANRKKKNN